MAQEGPDLGSADKSPDAGWSQSISGQVSLPLQFGGWSHKMGSPHRSQPFPVCDITGARVASLCPNPMHLYVETGQEAALFFSSAGHTVTPTLLSGAIPVAQ